MSFTKSADYVAALTTLKGIIDHDPTGDARPAAQILSEASSQLASLLRSALHRSTRYAVAPGADLPALVAAVTAEKGSAAAIGDLAEVDVDCADTALATEKGSAIVAGDVFRLTNVTGASEAVEYVGNLTRARFDIDPAY